MIAGVENPDVIDFGEIVILSCQPEDRHSRNSALIQIFAQARRRQSLIDGVCRTREQSYLLPGEDRDGPGLGEARDPIEMIRKIGEKLRGAGKFSVTQTSRVHHALMLKRNRWRGTCESRRKSERHATVRLR